MQFTHVHDERGAQELKERLSGVTSFALDCEAAGFHRYSDRLCLLQVSTRDQTWIVDPFQVDADAALREAIEDPDIEVVMHGSDFDLRLLSRDLGINLRALFDTQVAAALLGSDALGLAALLEARFDVKLSKKYQRADWAERPLTDGMLEYAAADTHYLLELARQLKAQLVEAGREDWVDEECLALEEASAANDPHDTGEPQDPVLRFKGARSLDARQVTALRTALEWRDELARARDKAPFRVVGNPPLLELAVSPPTRAEDLAQLKGFPKGLARVEGKDLLDRLRLVAELPEAELIGYPRKRSGGPGRPTPEMEAVFDRLKEVRNKAADAVGLPRGTLLANGVLLEMTRVLPTNLEELGAIEGMRRWKLALTGDALLAALKGR